MRDASADEDFQHRYLELVRAVHMVRRAAERAMRAGVLPALEFNQPGATPLQACEGVARVLYAAATGRKGGNPNTTELAGLSPDEFKFESGSVSNGHSA